VSSQNLGDASVPPPSRTIHHGDALEFLQRGPLPADHSIITSLPDISEVPKLLDWRSWFIDAVTLCCQQLADDAVAIFYQTDIKRDGVWVDKGHMVQLGATAAGSALLWHKIVCRAPAGTTTFGRPAFGHMLCVSRRLRLPIGASSADVLPAQGQMSWPRAMGSAACEAAVAFLQKHTACRTVVDPFCGLGSALAIANAAGFHAVGVELSAKRAARARLLTWPPVRP
jgi:hypothetical protein